QPPHGRSRSMATSRAARSTPVWPPLMIFMRHHAAMTQPGTEADRGHYRNLRCKTVEAYRQVGGSARSSNGLNGGSNFSCFVFAAVVVFAAVAGFADVVVFADVAVTKLDVLGFAFMGTSAVLTWRSNSLALVASATALP